MNLEKGISRIGIVFGVICGCTLIFLAWKTDLYFNLLSHFDFKYEENHTHLYNTGEIVEISGFKILRQIRITNEDAPSKLMHIVLPKVGTVLGVSIALFLSGFYLIKGVFETINWVIRGFRG
ncbi:hypothetical protein [Waddlia chondrophila]|uniref:hypothetical protein n=1 Tax=Waddlia chondrophila TaxID=71667 RepID=UPI0005A51176|nr:hypothetical protein [Waddlia chondrophila]